MANRCVVYLVNQHPLYMRMAINSIRTLREHNKDITVRCYYVLDGSQQTLLRGRSVTQEHQDLVEAAASGFVDCLDALDVVRHEVAPLKIPGEENFFHINRVYLGNVPEESVLYLDGDTFIFGDVANLFEAYKDYDYAGYEARWAYDRDWQSHFHRGNKPFGSGVMLWNNGQIKPWTIALPMYSEVFRKKQCALGEWLYTIHPDCLLREEFSVGHHLALWKLKTVIMDRKHCITMYNNNDWKELKETTIFHTYTPGWEEGYNRIYRKSKKSVAKGLPHVKTRNILE